MSPGIKASAYSGGRYMNSADFRAAIGDSIEFEYFDGTEYQTGTFRYSYTYSSGGFTPYDQTAYPDISSHPFLEYVTYDVGMSLDPTAITVKIQPQYSIFNTSKIYTWCAMTSGSTINSAAYQSSEWDWVYNSGSVRYTSPEFNNSSWMNGNYGSMQCVFIPAYFDSQSISSGYSLEARFYGTKGSYSGDRMFFYIGLPYIDEDATVSNGTYATTGTGTSPDINVNVDVDMTETNGILSGIKQSIDNLVQAILNGLKALFIPSDGFMDDFKDDMQDLLEDHLGGLYEAEQIMVDSFEQLPEVAAKSEIYIPPAQLPLGGETFTVGGWHVPLKVSGLPSLLYDGIAFIIDFLCIAGFLRMCRNKLEIFLNPDSEVIQS